jgi:hypothetical protein
VVGDEALRADTVALLFQAGEKREHTFFWQRTGGRVVLLLSFLSALTRRWTARRLVMLLCHHGRSMAHRESDMTICLSYFYPHYAVSYGILADASRFAGGVLASWAFHTAVFFTSCLCWYIILCPY